MAGCWPNYFRPLIEKVSGWYALFAVAYVTLVVFAVIRIITAIFLKQTLQAANSDMEMMVNEKRTTNQKTMEKMAGVFKALDIHGTGKIALEEFSIVMSNPDVKAWMSLLDLEVHDVESLFYLLDDGDGQITYEEFIPGIMRLKGQARSLDVVSLCRHFDSIETLLEDMDHKLDVLQHVSSSSP